MLFATLLAGCQRTGTGIAMPEWDPAAAADRAFAEYDTIGDHKLSREEVKKCPGLSSSMERFDRDRDGSISRDELTSLLHNIRQQDAALVEICCVIMHNGQPLEGALVKFVPETFMGDTVKPATGVTGRDGTAFPSVADEELPENFRGRVHGVPCGIFRVVVTHFTARIPARYNTQTDIGRVVSRRDHEMLTINF